MPQLLSPSLRALCFRWIINSEHWKNMRGANEADIHAVALPRVMAVLAGEVKWSEASNADKEIWKCRSRRVDSLDAATYLNVYDTAVVLPSGYGWHPERSRAQFRAPKT